MSEIDVTDETIIDADAHRVFAALVDEYMGVTEWWMPHYKAEPLDGPPFGQPGGASRVKVSGVGAPKFTLKTVEVEPDRLLRVEYEGDFTGEGIWTLNREDDKTRLSYRWRARPNTLMYKLSAPFIDVGKLHSAVMQKGFSGLKSFLETSS